MYTSNKAFAFLFVIQIFIGLLGIVLAQSAGGQLPIPVPQVLATPVPQVRLVAANGAPLITKVKFSRIDDETVLAVVSANGSTTDRTWTWLYRRVTDAGPLPPVLRSGAFPNQMLFNEDSFLNDSPNSNPANITIVVQNNAGTAQSAPIPFRTIIGVKDTLTIGQ